MSSLINTIISTTYDVCNGYRSLFLMNNLKGMSYFSNILNMATVSLKVGQKTITDKISNYTSNVTTVSKKYYDVTINYPNGEDYKMRMRKGKRGPKTIDLKFLDISRNDITNDLEQYMGPDKNFYGISYTPNDFGYKKLYLIKINTLIDTEEEIEVDEYSVINIY